MTLSLMVITRAEPNVRALLKRLAWMADVIGAEFVVGHDLSGAIASTYPLPVKPDVTVPVLAKGYLESVHDEVLAKCTGDYVLRLDDDEYPSPAMFTWLQNGDYLEQSLWKFPRLHLWKTRKLYLKIPQLFPDHQTRLGYKTLMGGRTHIHCGSPHGGGHDAGVAIEHHKFLLRNEAERKAIIARYDSVAAGAGTCFAGFQTPEVNEDTDLAFVSDAL